MGSSTTINTVVTNPSAKREDYVNQPPHYRIPTRRRGILYGRPMSSVGLPQASDDDDILTL